MEHPLIEQGYIPLDKSEYIRKGALCILNKDYDPVIDFLEDYHEKKDICSDLYALKKAAIGWKKGDEKIYVGESGTLFRILQFISWKYDLGKKFVKTGTLFKRKIYDNPDVVSMTSSERLKLDKGTSQWETAAVLCGSEERVSDAPLKLVQTYKVVDEFKEKGLCLDIVYDRTILRQAETFVRLYNGEKVDFEPEHAEDYCFARAFGFITQKEARIRWPNLEGHETNRLEEMEKALGRDVIDSLDHRVAQAEIMKKMFDRVFYFSDTLSPRKSWPEFFSFTLAVMDGLDI